jgi:hypothetical protein
MPDDSYSEEDAVLNAKLAILEAQKVAAHTQEWVIITDRWLNLANFIRGEHEVRQEEIELCISQVSAGIASIDEIRERLGLPKAE